MIRQCVKGKRSLWLRRRKRRKTGKYCKVWRTALLTWRKRCKRSQFQNLHQFHKVYKTTCFSAQVWDCWQTLAQCNGQAAPLNQMLQSAQNPTSWKPKLPSNTNNKSSTPPNNTHSTHTPYTRSSSTPVGHMADTTMHLFQTERIGTGLMIVRWGRSLGMRWESMAILIGWLVGPMRICCFIGMWELLRIVIRIRLRCRRSWWKRSNKTNKR